MRVKASQSASFAPAAGRTEAMLSLCMLAAGSLLRLIGWSGRTAGTFAHWAEPGMSNQRMEDLVGTFAFWAGSAAVIWWLSSMSMAFLAAACELRGRQLTSKRLGRWTPSFMRRLALAVLGLTLLGAPGAQAAVSATPGVANSADSASPEASRPDPSGSPGLLRSHALPSAGAISGPSASPDRAETSHPTDSLDPGWAVGTSQPEGVDRSRATSRDRPPSPPHGSDALDPGWTPSILAAEPGLLAPEPRRSPVDRPTGRREVAVRAGDSLWVLASRELGPRATDLDIARYWPRWYTANRDVIGPDPDHLLPGTVLRIPAQQ